MIKKFLLGLKKDYSHKHRNYHSYDSAKEFGIIFEPEKINTDTVNKLVEKLKNDNKITNVISYSEDDLPKSFSQKDISLTGKIQKSELLDFVEKNYNFLLILTPEIDHNLEYLIKTTFADYKVGISNKYQHLFQMVVEGALQELDNDIFKYLKMIKNE